MSVVVLRCANCGTTQKSRGECEACHEGQVRFQCTGHTPGRWLDGPTCPQCGAVYGRPDPPPPRASESSPMPSPKKQRPRDVSSRSRDWRGPWSPRPGPERPEIEAESEVHAREKVFERLRDLMDRRYRGRHVTYEGDIGVPPPAVVAGGCLRVILLIFLFFVLSFFGLSFLGSSLIFAPF